MDIGCGLPSLISIDQISVSRISHPRDRFAVGESIYAVVKAVEPEGRVQLSHKELLGTWAKTPSCTCREKRWRASSAAWRTMASLWS